MNRRPNLIVVWLFCASFLMSASVRANGVLGQHNWDIGAHGWTNEFSYVGVNRLASGGNPLGNLEISFGATSEPEVNEVEWFDVVRVDSDLLFAGNWDTNQFLRFDFFSGATTPHDLQVQFHATNGNVWSYNVTAQVTQTQTWSSVNTPITYSTAWGPLPGFNDTAEQFLADLGAIDWVGLYIFREEAAAENYRLDNFILAVGVPEPSEYVLLAAALCVLLLGCRRRSGDAPPGRRADGSPPEAS
ncbi:MAG: PEP-CTERM sorting domain-containing protein [Verrucomicrobia bacterium]|nr:PEP-CTERM sorting domain-containing protein [Verrucomicrobiota bacterium]